MILIAILFGLSSFEDSFAQDGGGGIKTKWTIGRKKGRGCPRIGLCKLKSIEIKFPKLEDDADDNDDATESRINTNLPYSLNSCDELAPDQAILFFQEIRSVSKQIKITFLTELKKSNNDMEELIFDVEENQKLPNFILGKFDGGDFFIKAGRYNIEKDIYGKMIVVIDLL